MDERAPESSWNEPTTMGTDHVAQVPHAAAPPVATNYPRRVPGTHFDSQQRPEPAPEPPVEAPQMVQRQSVFDDIGSVPGPTLPASGQIAPTLPSSSAPQMVVGAAPVLPKAAPAPTPTLTEPMGSGPANNDITALRSAQMRASRQQRQGRLFGRSLLAFVLIGGVLGAGLYFGRSLLFPTDWDAQLTPIVNELQDANGVEFDETVPLVVLPQEQYDERLGGATAGSDWVDRVPEWRALGLATGDVTAATVGATLAETTSAFYDPGSRSIYRSDVVPATEVDLRLALIQALDQQQSETGTDETGTDETGTTSDGSTSVDQVETADVAEPADGAVEAVRGFTGVSPLSSIAGRAVDHLVASGIVHERRPAPEALPVPIAYEVAAIDILGEPILVAAGVERSALVPGAPYPASIIEALDDRPINTTSGLLQPGEVSLADPVALGIDDWSLVWGARLPQSTVDGLVGQVVADSYRPIERSGIVCFVGVFQTSDEAAGAAVLTALQSWAANAPVSTQAVATSLGATRVELQACDPGPGEQSTPNAGVVDALIDRQQLRLTN